MPRVGMVLNSGEAAPLVGKATEGAVIGGFLGRSLGLYGPGEPAGFLMATLGAVVLLFLYRMLRRPARV